MALVALPGTPLVPIGIGFTMPSNASPGVVVSTMDAAEEAVIMIGHIATSDGGTHTINTTGSSALAWRATSVTFLNAGTTVKVGLAAVDTTTGPPGRAVNAANIITFDVSRTMIGTSGDISNGAAWQTHVPDAGTKTIANGDLVAFCIQMIARGSADQVQATFLSNSQHQRPNVTSYTSAAYSPMAAVPNLIITFSDGAIGYFYGGEIFDTQNSVAFNNASASREYGQLFNLPFPLRIDGIYGWINLSGDSDMVLYSGPLSGSPVAEKTITMDANTGTAAAARKFAMLFPAPYTYAAGTDIAVAFKPGSTNITTYYKTLANAAHRVTDPFGTSGYGIKRATGAFANANSSLDHFYIGLLVGAFDAGGGGGAGRTVQVNADSLVA